MESTSEGSIRWALLIGINHYPNLGSEWQLEGCINDVHLMQEALVRRFGFTKDRITMLLDAQATRAGILAAMEDMLHRVQRDDIVLFHFSGHGSRQTDEPDGDEPDGMDETLVPSDSGRPPKKNQDISDDEIHTWLCRLADLTPYITLVFDCCHSGTIVRDAFAGRRRTVPPDRRSFEELAVSAAAPSSVAAPDRHPAGPSGWLPLSERYTLLAACSHEESANEILVGEPKRTPHGAFTFHLLRELMDPYLRRPTWIEIFERMAPRVTAELRSQHPQLEGARHIETFGTRTIEPMTYISVSPRTGDTLLLEAGAACGLTVGSRWNVYPQATRNTSADTRPLGTVEVVSVGAVTSEARVVDACTVPSSWVGCRAMESSHCVRAARLAVEIDRSCGRSSAELCERISASRLVRAAGSGKGDHPDVRIYRIPPRSKAGESEPAPNLAAVGEESWVALGKDGDLLAPPISTRHPEAVELLVANLESVARLQGVLALRNSWALEGEVELRLHRLEGDRCVAPTLNENREPVFEVGDFIVAEIHNGTDRPLFIHLLDIGLTGKISPIYPVRGAREAQEPGTTIWVGKRQGERRRLSMPSDVALLRSGRPGSALEGTETFKLFATTAPANFDLLLQPAWRFRSSILPQSLDGVLAATFGVQRYAIHRGSNEDWTSVERSFRLRSGKTSL